MPNAVWFRGLAVCLRGLLGAPDDTAKPFCAVDWLCRSARRPLRLVPAEEPGAAAVVMADERKDERGSHNPLELGSTVGAHGSSQQGTHSGGSAAAQQQRDMGEKEAE
jgi:hypothetical protein